MSQKKPACVENTFEPPVNLYGLEEDLEQALKNGLSIPAYEERLAAQQMLCRDQSLKDQDVWNQGYRHRLRSHVLLASMAKSPSMVEHLWERVFTFYWAPEDALFLLELAIMTYRKDAFEAVADRLSGEMSDKEIEDLYKRALLSANGPLLACLMARFPAIPNPHHVDMMLDRGGPHVADKVNLLLGTSMIWRAGPLSLLPKLLSLGLWNQAEQVWARDPLETTEDESNVLDALDVALTQGQGDWSARLIALLPPGNPQGTGWNILATNVEEKMSSEQLADQACRLGPVARRKVWAKCLQEEKWDQLDRLVHLVPLSWIQALEEMPEVVSHLPQTQARLCAHHRAQNLSTLPASPTVHTRSRA